MANLFRAFMRTPSMAVSAVVLLSALCLALSGCNSAPSQTVPRGVSITYDDKLMFYKVEFDFTAVSHREAGRQYAQAIVEMLPDFESRTDAFLEQNLEEAHMTFDQVLQYANALRPNIPREYMDEIEGMGSVFTSQSDEIGNGRLSPNKIFVMLIFEDVIDYSGCSASAVFGRASATGKTIVGRNNDWTPDKDMDTWNALFIFHNGDKSSAGNGMLGELFPNNVFNRHHVFAAALDSSYGKPLPFAQEGLRSPTADLRYAIENSHTLAEAEQFIIGSHYATGSVILIADQDTAHVLEYDISRPEGQRGRIRIDTSTLIDGVSWDLPGTIASVNGYLLPGSLANHLGDPHNRLRFDVFRMLFSGILAGGPADVGQVQGVMGYTSSDGDAGTSGAIFRLSKDVATFQSLVMRLDTFETWLAYSAHGEGWPYTPVYYKVLYGDPFK